MPILKSKMKALKAQYGVEKGEEIYHKLESEGKNKRKNPENKAKNKTKKTRKKKSIFK